VGHVLARQLRHRIRPPGFADGADRRDVRLVHVERVLTEHLAGREINQPLEGVARFQRCLEHVVRADDVHAHRAHRARENRVHAGDPGTVHDVCRPPEDAR
jgi:hypothetical protein